MFQSSYLSESKVNTTFQMLNYERTYPKSYFDISTMEQFQQISGFKAFDYITELKNAKAVVNMVNLNQNDFYKLVINKINNNKCIFCDNTNLIKQYTSFKASNFVQFCCSKLLSYLIEQKLYFNNKQLKIDRQITQQNVLQLNNDLFKIIEETDVNQIDQFLNEWFSTQFTTFSDNVTQKQNNKYYIFNVKNQKENDVKIEQQQIHKAFEQILCQAFVFNQRDFESIVVLIKTREEISLDTITQTMNSCNLQQAILSYQSDQQANCADQENICAIVGLLHHYTQEEIDCISSALMQSFPQLQSLELQYYPYNLQDDVQLKIDENVYSKVCFNNSIQSVNKDSNKYGYFTGIFTEQLEEQTFQIELKDNKGNIEKREGSIVLFK